MNDENLDRMSERPEDIGYTPPARSRWSWPLAMVLVALVLVYMSHYGKVQRTPIALQRPGVGKKIVKMPLESLTGDPRKFDAKDLMNKVTIVNYWGPWCPRCRDEFPFIVQLEKFYSSRPEFQLVSISCPEGIENPGDDLTEHIGKSQFVLKQNQGNFPLWHDPKGISRSALCDVVEMKEEHLGYPLTMVIDREAKIRGIWVGFAIGQEHEIEELVQTLL